MKRLLLASACALALGAVPSLAADLRAPAPAAVPAFSWTGFYIGGHIGWGWTDADWHSVSSIALLPAFADAVPSSRFSHSLDGFLAGGQVGFNWQTGIFVFGLEASASGSLIDGGALSVFGARDDIFKLELDALAMLTGRVGVAFQNWLIYVTGGFAAGRVQASVVDVIGPSIGSGSESKWLHGWTVGGGAEWNFATNWSLAVQYNLVDLDGDRFDVGRGIRGGSYAWDIDFDHIHIVTGRLNWRFPVVVPAAPVAARF
jgi:outer membrane immunogenic protein